MNERLQTLLADLDRTAELAGPDWRRYSKHAAWLAESLPPEQMEFLSAVAARSQPLSERAGMLLAEALRLAVVAEGAAGETNRASGRPGTTQWSPPGSVAPARMETDREADASRSPDPFAAVIESLYAKLPVDSPARPWLLAWLATSGKPAAPASLVELLVTDPPVSDQAVVQALAPLFQRLARRTPSPPTMLTAAVLFPRLFDALSHPQLAAPVLDLANYLTREGLAAPHPATDRAPQLISLLGELSQSLARLEEHPDQAGLSPVELSRRVAHNVALAVSLCDALALIGDLAAIGKLHQTLGLHHRRLRTEAAAALARLGVADGFDELIALAAEPVARLRVLTYARELALLDRIDPQFQTPQARAEAELTVWLAEPTQFGVPPTALELFDHRQQHWPGFTEPVDCYLFRFTYAVTVEGVERSFSNIGIAGPLTHAFVADLGDLPPADIYAAYAGWQAEHAEIQEFEVAHLSRSEQVEVERLSRRMKDAGFSQIEPVFMGYFFGAKALVAKALRGAVSGIAVPGIAIADGFEEIFFPTPRSARPLEVRECYCIYKGRKLLASFNPAVGETAAGE